MLYFPKSIEFLATDFSGGCPRPQHWIEGISPKLKPRMLPPTQRRNPAYLNPLIKRPAAWTGLAIDLGGSVEWTFRPVDLAG
jgi:hypothetical protein